MSLRTAACALSRVVVVPRTHVRHYASEAATTTTSKNKKKGAVHPPRRTFLHQQYESIINHDRVMFIFQHNNLTVQEFTQLRQDLAQLVPSDQKATPRLTVIRSGIFGAVLRNTKYSNLAPLVAAGPVCVLHTNAQDTEHPDLLKRTIQAVSKNKKLLLLGGKIDNTLLTQEDVNKVIELPVLPQLQAELLGVIQAPARKLLNLLSSPAQQLHSVLDRRTE